MKFLTALKVILFGIIEGITEWLPVSSTGHLKLFNAFCPLGYDEAFMEVFEYVIQLFAILAVVIVFFKKIFPFGKTEEKKICVKKDVFSLWGKILLACIPAIVALPIDKLFEKLSPMAETVAISCTLIFYGIVFILIENKNKNKEFTVRSTGELTYKTAFFIGCFQLLAVIPGTSRSGITVIGALLLLVDRPTSAEFTFFLAIPTMVGASGYKILSFFMHGGSFAKAEIFALLIGCIVAFVVSLFTVKFLMSFVKKHDFKPFGIYRICLGVLVLSALVIPYMF